MKNQRETAKERRERLGLPSAVPDVPADDWEGLTNVRYALAVLRRDQEACPRPQESSSTAELSGVHSKNWHPLDGLRRLPPLSRHIRLADDRQTDERRRP